MFLIHATRAASGLTIGTDLASEALVEVTMLEAADYTAIKISEVGAGILAHSVSLNELRQLIAESGSDHS